MHEPTSYPLESVPPRMRVTGKHPTPLGYSYAVGSLAVGDGLRGIPMFDNMSISFSTRTPFLAGGPITDLPLFRLRYTNYPVYQSSSGNSLYRGGERWALEVLCTPYAHRAFIQALCIERALPQLRQRLCDEDAVPRDRRRMRQICWYRMAVSRITWEEDEDLIDGPGVGATRQSCPEG
jgi:hypothetical protein